MHIETTSYWNKTATKTEYPKLEENIEVDTLIVGGGITGITCAYCLAQRGSQPVVIEAGGLCDGTTGNTTGKVTIQHGIIYSEIEKKYGMEYTKMYADSQSEALNFVRNVVAAEAIDCQLTDNTAYIFASDEKERLQIIEEYEIALRLGIPSEYFEKAKFPPGNHGLLGYKNQAVFHSVRYVEGIAKAVVAKGAKIYCSTKAIKVEDGDIKTITCENGITIRAKHLVQATQYPIYDGPNIFYARLYPKRAYGMAIDAKNDLHFDSYINVGEPSRSIRTHVENGKRILIVVGEGHTTARGEDDMEKHLDKLYDFADSFAGVNRVLAKWSAQDYNTPDKIPYIGRISDHSNVFIATGFKKWGLTSGTLAGNMIADMIATGNNQYEELYSRKRKDIITSIGTAISEVASSVYELVKSKFEPSESVKNLKQGEGRVIYFDGKSAGIYRDFENNITILNVSCEHMGTVLNFNNAEKTWDCPAHGGRYSSEGKLLEGPPKDSLKVLYKGKYSDLK
ncbi:MAG: hypothetical protein A2Y15_02925 [Clostridiales bacterium GWF2_36_10]|nr:MAG: hypothetical protein A2Y15_02925 [Clostridiales bacterium GWF2_36_10]HAN20927.1 hypothetical protein [Clostridiales bacterium]